MSNSELLIAGFKLLIFGMGMVFIFLVIMIFTVKIMQKVLAPFADFFEDKTTQPKKNNTNNDNDSATAIAAAVAIHLAKNSGSIVKSTKTIENSITSTPSKESQIISPLPGTILKVLVNTNDKVSAGDTVFILEAVKMENEIKAEADGIIKEIKVSKNNTVQADDILATITTN